MRLGLRLGLKLRQKLKLKTTFGWLGGWLAGEMENKAIFQLEVIVEVEVEVGAWQNVLNIAMFWTCKKHNISYLYSCKTYSLMWSLRQPILRDLKRVGLCVVDCQAGCFCVII